MASFCAFPQLKTKTFDSLGSSPKGYVTAVITCLMLCPDDSTYHFINLILSKQSIVAEVLF